MTEGERECERVKGVLKKACLREKTIKGERRRENVREGEKGGKG